MEDNLKSHIQKDIPKTYKVFGVYDENEERWIKFTQDEFWKVMSMSVQEISQFVRSVMRETSELGNLFGVERMSFDLEIKGNHIRFSVSLKNLEGSEDIDNKPKTL